MMWHIKNELDIILVQFSSLPEEIRLSPEVHVLIGPHFDEVMQGNNQYQQWVSKENWHALGGGVNYNICNILFKCIHLFCSLWSIELEMFAC